MSTNPSIELFPTKTQEVVEITLPEFISNNITEYINSKLRSHNPYTCDEAEMIRFAKNMMDDMLEYSRMNDDSDVENLIRIIKRANAGENIPPVFLRNTPSDPMDSLLSAENRKGYNYGGSEHDRMKMFFYSEWTTWLIATLFNYDAVIHPSEHGGNNRFHLISPFNLEDEKLRNTGASTGGGNFYQHNDATVYTDLKSELEVETRLASFNTDLTIVSERLHKPAEQIVSEVTSGKFTRVDALLLKGILNLKTETHIGTPSLLQKHLEMNAFSKEEILILSKMPIAHIAGPADGEISGFVGEINKIIDVNDEGDIISTCLNGSENRMIYVGGDKHEEILFEKFLELLRTMPTYKFLLTSKDLLFIPNSSFGNRTNVTHGRGRLTDSEYNIPIGNNKCGRRMHCRQYVLSRVRDNKTSYFSE